ncbi:hypothetical protein NDU88_007078 [Pleurodeles waltl]|uniref:Uncharacterized protein n=1 Tax=Pleurodeles waltl TaxID=8319 RepID=A0AAV7LUD6_PLEWA|nr:hypothetical protein NDU88_007078 [Pleurodeles waltl]
MSEEGPAAQGQPVPADSGDSAWLSHAAQALLPSAPGGSVFHQCPVRRERGVSSQHRPAAPCCLTGRMPQAHPRRRSRVRAGCAPPSEVSRSPPVPPSSSDAPLRYLFHMCPVSAHSGRLSGSKISSTYMNNNILPERMERPPS